MAQSVKIMVTVSHFGSTRFEFQLALSVHTNTLVNTPVRASWSGNHYQFSISAMMDTTMVPHRISAHACIHPDNEVLFLLGVKLVGARRRQSDHLNLLQYKDVRSLGSWPPYVFP
jgi:hypothetical protein